MATVGRTSSSKNGARRKAAPPAAPTSFLGHVGNFFRILGNIFGVLTTLILVAAILAVCAATELVQQTTVYLPQSDKMLDYRPGGITTIYATDIDPKTGQKYVLGRIYSQFKEFAPIVKEPGYKDYIPDVLKNATVAIEDERFYKHRGIDFESIARAIVRDVQRHRLSEGASTLTQQLARNTFLTQKKTFSRKFQEILLSILMEKNFSKEQILEMYLNDTCYGVNTYGVRAAAQVYFGRNAKDLSLSQAALIAGLPQSPAHLEPFKNKAAATRRRNVVLKKMRELGYISAADCATAQGNGVFLVSEKPHIRTEMKAPYFTTYVIQQLKRDYGEEKLNTGGLQVDTTLNYSMQKEAERALINGVMKNNGSGVTQGALVSVEPRTGYIRAMVGGVDFNKYQFNNAAQGGRQPGSSFKPFVYVTAMALHPGQYSADGEVDNRRINHHGYRPESHGPEGFVSLRNALAWSYNAAAVNTADSIGILHVVETANKLGIQSPLEPTLSLAIGSYDVTPLEMASAYAAFANHGSHAAPMAIIRVVDQEGVMLANNQPRVEQAVLPESAVAGVSDAMRSVIEYGTAANAEGIHDVEEAHGKTGTTNDNKDAWFVGFTPELSTAVWVCGLHYEKRGKLTIPVYRKMQSSDAEVTGGHVCAPIWARFMKAAIPIQRAAKLPRLRSPDKPAPAAIASPAPTRLRRHRRHNNPPRTNGDMPGPAPEPTSLPAGDAPTASGDKPGDASQGSEPKPVDKPDDKPAVKPDEPAVPDKPADKPADKPEAPAPDKPEDARPQRR